MAGEGATPEAGASNSQPVAPATITVQDYEKMTEEQKAALPVSRRKKLEKQLAIQRKKQA